MIDRLHAGGDRQGRSQSTDINRVPEHDKYAHRPTFVWLWSRSGVTAGPSYGPAARAAPLFLASGDPDDMVARDDDLVGFDGDLATGRLGSLLAGGEVHLIEAKDLHRLDGVEGVHDRIELPLVERAARRPSPAHPARGAADHRVQVRVELVANVGLDALRVGPRGHLQVDDHRDRAKTHGLQAHRRPGQLARIQI